MSAPSRTRAWSARTPILIGLSALILLVGGMGVWSATVQIAGAVIAPGVIEVEGRRRAVQHPDGGVVGEILVRDGDSVAAGDVVVRFDDTLVRSELAIVEGQLFELLARKARLMAERDGADEPDFPAELTNLIADRPEIAETVQGERNLFSARRETLDGQRAQLAERARQIDAQVEGTEAQIAALEEQRRLIADERTDQEDLLSRGLTQQSRVLSLQREAARLDGELGDLVARTAQLRGQIAEIEVERLNLAADLREQAITTLRDLEYREVELRERRLAAEATLDRLDVRSPADGIVYDRQVNTSGQVVRPADTMMSIVPQGQALVIQSRVPAISIDQVTPGQAATMRFPAFNSRTTPEIFGTVSRVSPDAFRDERTGASYYTAEIVPTEESLPDLETLQLVPGMPVEAFILTGDRTPLSFLVKPITDYVERAFRES